MLHQERVYGQLMQHKISVALIHQFSITVTPKNAFLGVKFGGG